MRSAARQFFLIAWFLSIALAGGAASAPPQRPATVTALVGKVQGPLNLRYDPTKSGPVSGDIFGDRIEGYLTFHSAGKHTLAFLQFKRNAGGAEVATNVYTADYDLAQTNWMGVSHALDVPLGGASATHNATSFRTTGPHLPLCARDPACVARNNLPHRPRRRVYKAAAIDAAAAAGFPVYVHRTAGSVVWRAAASGNSDGVLTGTILGDTLTGHYARRAGTIVFLRLRNGRPIQVFTGTLDLDSTFPGAVKGGNGFPLAKGVGGPFSWSVVLNDQFVSGLRSARTGWCLTPLDPAAGPGGTLTTATACLNTVNVSWVVSAFGADQGRTLYSLVSVATGLCLEMPGAYDAPVTQQICNGAPRQSLVMEELQQTGTLPDGFPLYTRFVVNTTAAFGSLTNGLNLHAPTSGCLAIVVQTGAVVESSCDEDHPKFKARVTNPKAGWEHNP